MAEQPASQEEVIAQQKAQCPFCKIVAGEIPANKVFEDDKILAIADINPAAPGHLLVMPKEHYPIMPLIPPETFSHLFSMIKFISRAQKKAVPCQQNSIFIANGGAAGQRSSHFMLHIIPREPNDGLTKDFSPPEKQLDPQQTAQLAQMLSHNLKIALKDHPPPGAPSNQAPQAPLPEPPQSGEEQGLGTSEPTQEQKKLLAERLEKDEGLRNAVMHRPQEVAELSKKDPQLQQLFAGVDIVTLAGRLREVYGANTQEDKQEQSSELASKVPPQQEHIPQAPQEPQIQQTTQSPTVSQEQRKALGERLESDDGLRSLIIQDPDKAITLINADTTLRDLFTGVDITALSQRLKEAYGS